MLRTLSSLLLAAFAVGALAQESYDSLEDFCLRTNADTPENCRCGQATADAIMSDQEQAVALAMMTQQQPPELDPEAQMSLMQKVSQVTKGCGSDD